MATSLEPTVTIKQELIVPMPLDTISPMKDNDELIAFSRRMHEICDDMGLPNHGRQSELAKAFGISQKGARKWLEAEAFPRWEHVIRITEWANVTIEWLMSGRSAKRNDELYPTQAIAHVAQVMQAMEPEQQYLVARLADQVTKPPGAPQEPTPDAESAPKQRNRSR